jgi:hypothetical protein
MNQKMPQGQYRTTPDGDRPAMVYVWGGSSSSYVTEAAYREKGYSPDFETLATEDEYDSARS